MQIARFSIEKPIFTWLLILTCLLGGIWSSDDVSWCISRAGGP
jgi:multidrug efflux pump subunit AcrB